MSVQNDGKKMLHEALRLIRVFHDLKQWELAEKLEISKSYISEVESGKKVPSLELIEKYSNFFNIPSSSILYFSEELSRDTGASASSLVAQRRIASKVISFLKFIELRTDSDARKETEEIPQP
jgi:transcriptional regulator with XRE-family HTH domain